MEKNIINKEIELIMIDQGDQVIFQLKDSKAFNRNNFQEIKNEIGFQCQNCIVIYPENRIIETTRVIIENTQTFL